MTTVSDPRILIRSHRSLHTQPGGGAGRLMCNIATALSDSGWEVSILCPAPDDKRDNRRTNQAIDYYSFPYTNPETAPGRLVNSVRGVRAYRSVSDTVRPDVILDDISHVPFYPAHFLSSGSTNVLFMHTAFFNHAWTFTGPVKGTIVNLIDRTLPYLNDPEIVCAGGSTANRMHDIANVNSTHVLNPCINLPSFTYEFDPSSRRILYLGRLTPRKNVSCLIHAWAEIESEYDDYVLSIAGTGSEEANLKHLADQLDLDRIEFLGYVSEKRKVELYSDALLFCIPSLMEGYITTGLEALASGTPVVGADTYGIKDYIETGSNGFLFETDDPSDLADTLRRALSDPAGLRPLAERGREIAEAHRFEQFRSHADDLFRQFI